MGDGDCDTVDILPPRTGLPFAVRQVEEFQTRWLEVKDTRIKLKLLK